jgi:hypothetical protein
MHPTAQHARSINGQQSSLDQERNHARAKQLLQPRVITGKMRVCRATLFLSEFASEFSSAHHMKPALAVKQTVGYQRVQVRMKVEIFAESVDRHDDGWNAIVRRVANAACIAERITQKVTHALMRDAAELLEQSAVKSKVRPQHLWDRECEVSMRHRREDRLRKHRAKYLQSVLKFAQSGERSRQ